MSFSKLAVAKFVASGVVAIGTSKIVKGVISAHVKPETLLDKVTIAAAAWVISGIATTKTKEYTDKTIDETAEHVTKIVDAVKVTVKLDRINRGASTFEKEGLDQKEFFKDDKGKWRPTKIEETTDENS